jgi:hypothetical protein
MVDVLQICLAILELIVSTSGATAVQYFAAKSLPLFAAICRCAARHKFKPSQQYT